MGGYDPLLISVLLALLGCGVLILEVLLPSAGALSILAVAALGASIVVAFRYGGVQTGVTMLLVEMIAAPTALGFALKLLPSTPIGKVLIGEAPREEEILPDDPRRALVGKIGTARSKMLPSGAVEIDGQMVDAVTRGDAIEPGQYVQVVEVRGNRVVVRAAASGDRPQAKTASDDLLSRPLTELGLGELDDSRPT